IGKSFVLSSEQDCDWAVPCEIEKLNAGRLRICQITLGCPASRRETRDTHDSIERLLDSVAIPDAFDDIAGFVRNPLEPPGIVFHRTNKIEVGTSHVLHRANLRRDVDGILRLVQYDSHT